MIFLLKTSIYRGFSIAIFDYHCLRQCLQKEIDLLDLRKHPSGSKGQELEALQQVALDGWGVGHQPRTGHGCETKGISGGRLHVVKPSNIIPYQSKEMG